MVTISFIVLLFMSIVDTVFLFFSFFVKLLSTSTRVLCFTWAFPLLLLYTSLLLEEILQLHLISDTFRLVLSLLSVAWMDDFHFYQSHISTPCLSSTFTQVWLLGTFFFFFFLQHTTYLYMFISLSCNDRHPSLEQSFGNAVFCWSLNLTINRVTTYYTAKRKSRKGNIKYG